LTTKASEHILTNNIYQYKSNDYHINDGCIVENEINEDAAAASTSAAIDDDDI
jgi:hypothetical protein